MQYTWNIYTYPSICQWTWVVFHILAVIHNAAVKIGLHVSFWISAFVSSGEYSEVEELGHVAVLFFISWGTVFLTVVASYFPTSSAPGFSSPRPLQRLSLIIVILTGVWWYLIMLLICTFLIMDDVERLFLCLLALSTPFLGSVHICCLF